MPSFVLVASLLLTAGAARGQNLVSDPHFASGISAWSLRLSPGITATLVRDPGPGADGSPGFAALAGATFNPVTLFARTCVPVQPGVVYSFGGAVRFRTAQQSQAFFTLNFYPDAACGTTILSPPPPPSSAAASGGTPGAWASCAGTGAAAPPGAASAALELNLSGVSTGGTPSVDFDDVYAGRAGTVEPPAAVPSLSHAGVLALGLALSLAGALAARPAR
ncbi:MAG: hypothetical protein IPL89_05735 [Acidobacteria bacterium]|nr:hypothetical protein [Acidobacteriota bacterium]